MISALPFEPGETVAIVGPSGAGKSTVFQLIERFYDPKSGAIAVDGVDMRDVDPAELRKRIALVPQDVTIFAATVAENIALVSRARRRREIEQAAHDAQATEFIDRMARL
jgi:ATP-binding cassette subfamily B protein